MDEGPFGFIFCDGVWCLSVVDTVIDTGAGDAGDVRVSQLRLRPPRHAFVFLCCCQWCSHIPALMMITIKIISSSCCWVILIPNWWYCCCCCCLSPTLFFSLSSFTTHHYHHFVCLFVSYVYIINHLFVLYIFYYIYISFVTVVIIVIIVVDCIYYCCWYLCLLLGTKIPANKTQYPSSNLHISKRYGV